MLFGSEKRERGIAFGLWSVMIVVVDILWGGASNLMLATVSTLGAIFLTMALYRAANFLYLALMATYILGFGIYAVSWNDHMPRNIIFFGIASAAYLWAYFEFRKFIAKRSSK